MRLIRAVILAFATFTRIPMPCLKQDDSAAALSIAFLPLVGAAIGGVAAICLYICGVFHLSRILTSVGVFVLPIIITGGIHIDGYLDTADALASWRDKERSLRILRDPHIGAFAVIRFIVYMLVYFTLIYEFVGAYSAGIFPACILLFVYVFSRVLAAVSVLTMPRARRGGMLAMFAKKRESKKAGAILAFLTALAIFGFIRCDRFFYLYGLFIVPCFL